MFGRAQNLETFLRLVRPLSLKIVFRDRRTAGQMLANKLDIMIRSRAKGDISFSKERLVVFGIPRGGLVIANEIALKLGCDMGILSPVRIVSEDKEITLGSVLPLSTVTNELKSDSESARNNFLIYLNNGISEQMILKDKERIFKNASMKALKYCPTIYKPINQKIVILADDGIYSGATALLALRWIKSQRPKEVILATPVAPLSALNKIKNDESIAIDHFEILKIGTSQNNEFVGKYYKNFEEVQDEEVFRILKVHRLNHC